MKCRAYNNSIVCKGSRLVIKNKDETIRERAMTLDVTTTVEAVVKDIEELMSIKIEQFEFENGSTLVLYKEQKSEKKGAFIVEAFIILPELAYRKYTKLRKYMPVQNIESIANIDFSSGRRLHIDNIGDFLVDKTVLDNHNILKIYLI